MGEREGEAEESVEWRGVLEEAVRAAEG